MPLLDDLRLLSEQVKKRQIHIRGEEATKHALVLPFLQVLGFDIHDPSEVQPEYIADFAKKRSNGQSEKVDYALRFNGQPALFVECKAADINLTDHDAQLARYFNATPSVRIAILTNGLCYRFFTDQAERNLMDASPFFEFDLLAFNERDVENLRPFTKQLFDGSSVQRHAEELTFVNKITKQINELLRNPSEEFVRFLLDDLELVDVKVTARVVERFMPIIKRAIQSAIVDTMTKSLQQEIASPSPAAAVFSKDSKERSDFSKTAHARASSNSQNAEADTDDPRLVTTAEELGIFEIVRKICESSPSKQPIAYKDTVNYFSINLGGSGHRWVVHIYANGNRKIALWQLPPERVQLLAPGFEVKAIPGKVSRSRLYFTNAKDFERLRAVVLAAYEAEVRRGDGDEDEIGSAIA